MKESVSRWASVVRRPSRTKPMNLIVAIVQDEDSEAVTKDLVESGVSVTKIGSTGGFLRRGNATLLMAVESSGVAGVLDILQAACHSRQVPISASVPDLATVGGAVVLVLDIKDFHKF